MIIRNGKSNEISLLTKAICLFFISIPFDFIPIGEFGSISKLIVFIPLITAVFSFPRKFQVKKGIVLILLFLAIGLFSSLFSAYDSALDDWFSLFQNLCIIMLFLIFDYTETEYYTIEKSILFSGLLFSVLLLLFSYVGESGRVGISILGAEQNFNYACGYLILPQAICLNRAQGQTHKHKVIYYLFYIFMITIVFLSGSRGGLLATFVVFGSQLIINLFVRPSSLNKKLTYILIFVLVCFLLFELFQIIVPMELKSRYITHNIISDHGSNRIEIWESMIESFSHFGFRDKLFGVGIGASPYYAYNGYYAAHNAFIAFLLECGIVGVSLYIVLLIKLGSQSIKRKCYCQFGALLGFVVLSMTTTLTNFKPMWILFFYIIIGISNDYNAYENGIYRSKK